METLDLALNLKRLRLKQGLTLDRLAEATGATKGLLSQIENFRVLPSIPMLYKLAAALQVAPADLLMPPSPSVPWVHTPAGAGETVEREFPESGFLYQALARNKTGKLMEPFLLTIPPGSVRPPVTTAGDEYLYLVKGRLTFHLGDETIPLKTGDSLYFDGRIPHTPKNPGDGDAKLLVVYALPG